MQLICNEISNVLFCIESKYALANIISSTHTQGITEKAGLAND